MATISHAYHRIFDEPFEIERAFDADYLLYASAGTFILDIGDRRWMLPPQRAALIARGTIIAVRSKGRATASSVLFGDGEFEAPLPACQVFGLSELARQMILHVMRWDAGARCGRRSFECVLQGARIRGGRACYGRGRDLVAETAVAGHGGCHRPHAGTARPGSRFQCSGGSCPSFGADAVTAIDAELGMSFRDFRHRARMVKAKELLLAGRDPVTEIGLACGFESTSSFIKAFRTFAGATPRQYRAGKAG
ncbi:AraC family transcriptional regulator [Neorhizobium galegae]|nr:AraC family transcriptional regulator [Neorhizobium galegae]